MATDLYGRGFGRLQSSGVDESIRKHGLGLRPYCGRALDLDCVFSLRAKRMTDSNNSGGANDAMDEVLKPCPFCNATPEIISASNGIRWAAPNCGCIEAAFDYEVLVKLDVWNRRAPDEQDARSASLGALVKAAERLELLLVKYQDRFKLQPKGRILVEQVILELRT